MEKLEKETMINNLVNHCAEQKMFTLEQTQDSIHIDLSHLSEVG